VRHVNYDTALFDLSELPADEFVDFFPPISFPRFPSFVVGNQPSDGQRDRQDKDSQCDPLPLARRGGAAKAGAAGRDNHSLPVGLDNGLRRKRPLAVLPVVATEDGAPGVEQGHHTDEDTDQYSDEEENDDPPAITILTESAHRHCLHQRCIAIVHLHANCFIFYYN
jgi:hypothetical protein